MIKTLLIPFRGDIKKLSIKGNRIRARILPHGNRVTNLFAPNTISWLEAFAEKNICIDNQNKNGKKITYLLSLIGITNRPLPGYRKAGINLFKTTVKIMMLGNERNLDQCTIEFSQRVPINVRNFYDELSRQICSAGNTNRGRLAFYAHGSSNAALISDFEALRLCVLKTVPVINIDWLDIDSGWDVIWNPCSNLKTIRKKIEAKLIKVLDTIIEQTCASRCNLLTNDSKTFFDNIYLPYRSHHNLPALNKVICALPPAESQTIGNVLRGEFNPFLF